MASLGAILSLIPCLFPRILHNGSHTKRRSELGHPESDNWCAALSSARKVGLFFASVLKRRILWNLLPVDSTTKAYEEQILVPSSRKLSFRVLASVISLIMRFVPSWRSSLLGVGNWLKTHVCIASASV